MLWSSKKSILGLVLLGVVTVLLTIAVYLPASWLGAVLEKQTSGRLSLGDVQGSFWHGSAFLGVAVDQKSPVTALFPGRFSWKISPKLLLGRIDVEITNEQVLSQPVVVQGNFAQWQVSASNLRLPSERLKGLGAPLNTIGPTGKIVLSWEPLEMTRDGNRVSAIGNAQLELNEMASRASSIRPLGSYRLVMKLNGERIDMNLLTIKGPMNLEGSGALVQGRMQFSGKAYAQAGQEERLANLLNLLGRRRFEGDKQIIALEYR